MVNQCAAIMLVALVVSACGNVEELAATPVTTSAASVRASDRPTSTEAATTTQPSTTPPPTIAPPSSTLAPSTIGQSAATTEAAGADTAGGLPTEECLDTMQVAAGVDEMSDTVEDLYPALLACSSLQDWSLAAAQTDALDGVNPETFAYNSCVYGGPADSATCVEAIANDPFGLSD